MMGRLLATAGAVTPVAAVAVENAKGAMAQTPTVWWFLGTPFEAAGFVSAIFACGAARWWIGAAASLRKEYRWTIDAPVTLMALACAAAAAARLSPDPLLGLGLGAGVGMIGEGIFKLAERQARAAGMFGTPEERGITKAMKKLDKID